MPLFTIKLHFADGQRLEKFCFQQILRRKKLVGRYFFGLRGFNVPSFFPIVNIFALEIIKPFIKEDNTKVFSSKVESLRSIIFYK